VPKILILLFFVTFSTWGFMIYQHWQMSTLPMSEMWMPPSLVGQWQISDFFVVYIMWAVMMAAMMIPSAMPMIGSYSKICRQRFGNDMPYSVIFSLAYLLVWFVFSIVLTLLQWQLHELQWLTAMMESNNRLFAATIFIVAGAYQFTPIKNACLQHCRSPFSFLLNYWRPGKSGAFYMGFIHGNTCLGCCWAQMLLMFAVGVMNITAMVLITLLVLIEKTFPKKEGVISKLIGIGFCVYGLQEYFFP